jgi:hypothetical protein
MQRRAPVQRTSQRRREDRRGAPDLGATNVVKRQTRTEETVQLSSLALERLARILIEIAQSQKNEQA